MSGFSNPVVGGGGDLVRERVRSPGYVAGVDGWSINQDGSAEFNDVTVRGEVDVGTSTQYVKVYNAPSPIDGPVVAFNTDSDTFPTDGYVRAITAGPGAAYGALELSSPAATTQDPAQISLVSGDSSGTVERTAYVSGDMDLNGSLTVEPLAGNTVLAASDTGISANVKITLPGGVYIKRGGLAVVTFANGWGNFGSTFQPVRYAEMPEGWGALVGVASGGTATNGTVVCTIPNLWPTFDHTFDVPCNNGKHAQIIVRKNGNIELSNPDTGVTWFSFGEIRWPVAGF